MNIKLTEKYYLKSNSMNYILCEIGIVEDEESKHYGKEVFKHLGYYPNIKFLISGLLEHDIKQQDIETLAEIKVYINNIAEIISKNIKEV